MSIDKVVSLVVPVYNLENTLEECLNSMLCQSYKNLEILLIDDGSTDNSYNICKRYADLDKRIKVLTHPNRGVSYTRNIGIKNSTGYYIMFVDGDDVIKSDMVEIYVNNALHSDYDIVIGGIDFVENGVVTYKIPEHEDLNRCQLLSNVCVDTTGIYGYVPNKLYKLENIKKHLIYFNEEMYAQEDFDFAISLYEIANKILQIPYSGYIYYYKTGKRKIPMFDLLKNQNKLLSICYNNKVDSNKISVLKNKICDMLYCTICSCADLTEIESYKPSLTYPLDYTGKSLKVKIITKLYNKQKYKTIYSLIKLKNCLKGFIK